MIKMISNNLIFIGVLGALLIFGLSVYLGFLYKKIKRMNALIRLDKRRAKEREEIETKEREDFYSESIRIISLAALQKQCDISEACIRLKKLLVAYPKYENDEKLESLNQMYEEIKAFPILTARKELSKQDKFNQDKKRFMIESKFQDQMQNVFSYIHQEFKKV